MRIVSPRNGMRDYYHGWQGWNPQVEGEGVLEVLASPAHWTCEMRTREAVPLQGTEGWEKTRSPRVRFPPPRRGKGSAVQRG